MAAMGLSQWAEYSNLKPWNLIHLTINVKIQIQWVLGPELYRAFWDKNRYFKFPSR